jgi:hypothetical protein
MSLFSTIAHDGPVPARGLPKRMWMMAAGLVLTATVGFVIVNSTAVEPLGTATATNAGLSHDEFVRLNTTALDALVPAAAAVKSQDVVDSFIYINTAALDALAPAAGAIETRGEVDSFIYLNTTALDALAPAAGAIETQQSNGPQ